jgi:hypothetical protein
MLRTLRAFVWLRWRMLINSLENTSARDTLERFSLAMEKLGPIMAGVLMIPSALLLGALGAAAGFALARGDARPLLFEVARYLLLTVPILSVFGPLLLPAADRTNPVRMLLLPISRGTLYIAQSATAFGDVWTLLMLPVVICVPLGLAVGGAVAASLVSLLAGALLVVTIVGISSVATSLLHLSVRDRRRGELLALLFILIIPAASMLPGLLQGERWRHAIAGGPDVHHERVRMRGWFGAVKDRAFAVYPTELYATTTRTAAIRERTRSAAALAGLGVSAALIHGLGVLTFGLVLNSPGSTGARRAAPMRGVWSRKLPGLSSGASAVAMAQLRLALRTSRGRSILLSPIMMLFIIGFFMRRNLHGMELGPLTLQTGLGLASFGSFVCLMSVLPLAMNQFAVDKAGVTRALLLPLTDREYLAGKAVGNALVAAVPVLLCISACFVTFPGGSAALWLALPLALLSTYLLVAPAAAALSAMFPRAVDMNSIGHGSNAHGVSGLLGMLSFVAAGAPSLAIAIAVSHWLRPALVPGILVVWCMLCYGVSLLLFVGALRVFGKRRENLAMLGTDN